MQCWEKKKHSKKDAQTLANKAKNERGQRIRIYHCPICDYWHLTHRPDFSKSKVIFKK